MLDILGQYDVIISGSDNFTTAYMVNDAAVMLKKPVAYGSIFRFDGQASTFVPYEGPCFRCIFANADSAGVGAELRRSWRPRCVARNRWFDSGNRNHQGIAEHRYTARWPPACLRRAGNVVPAVEGTPRPELHDLRSKRAYRSGGDSGVRLRAAADGSVRLKAASIHVGDFVYCRSKYYRDQLQLPKELGLVIEIKRNNFKILYPNDKRCWLPREALTRVRPELDYAAFLEKLHYLIKKVHALRVRTRLG